MHGQTLMSEFKYMVENEAPNDEGKSRAYLSIPQPDHKKEYWEKFEHHFKLALHGSQYVIPHINVVTFVPRKQSKKPQFFDKEEVFC